MNERQSNKSQSNKSQSNKSQSNKSQPNKAPSRLVEPHPRPPHRALVWISALALGGWLVFLLLAACGVM